MNCVFIQRIFSRVFEKFFLWNIQLWQILSVQNKLANYFIYIFLICNIFFIYEYWRREVFKILVFTNFGWIHLFLIQLETNLFCWIWPQTLSILLFYFKFVKLSIFSSYNTVCVNKLSSNQFFQKIVSFIFNLFFFQIVFFDLTYLFSLNKFRDRK